MNLMPNAASAAYTYLSAHPDDVTMKHNYQYYIRQPEVDEDEVVDLESDEYKFLYWQGALAYEKKNWADTVSTMEEVLDDYLASENKCRLSCEGDSHWQNHYTEITEYFTYLLKCKQKCQTSLLSMGFESGIEFLADVLNHIQIGYYNLEMPIKAAREVQSFLLLYPEDKDMIENKNIYSSMVAQDAFVEKPEIVFYHTRDTNEKKLLSEYGSNEAA